MTLRNVDKTFSLEEQRQEINEIAVDLDAINTTLTNWNSTQWDSAYSWGDHALAGYLTAEADTLATITGRGATTNDDITLGDASNQPELKLSLGVSPGITNYLTIFGSGNETYIRNTTGTGGGGSINIQARSGVALWQGTGTLGLYIDSDCAANLYYQSALKLKTTTTGVTITGAITATGGDSANWNTAYGWGDHAQAGYLTSSPTETDTLQSVTDRGATSDVALTLSNDVTFVGSSATKGVFIDKSQDQLVILDGTKLAFGTGDPNTTGGEYFFTWTGSGTSGDLVMEPNSNVSVTNNVYIRANTSQDGVAILNSGSTELFHLGNKKLETTSAGVTITGNLSSSNVGLTNATTSAKLNASSDINGNYTGWKEKGVASGSMSQTSIDSKTPTINDFNYPNNSDGMLIWSTSKIGFAAGAESPQFGTGVQMLFDSTGLILGGIRAFDRTTAVSTVTNHNIRLKTNGEAEFKGTLSIGSGSSAPADYGLIAYSDGNTTSNKSSVYARNIGGGRNFTGDNSAGATTFEVYSSGSVALTQSATSQINSIDTINTGGGDNAVKIRTQANQGGNPYIKFDAGGANFVVGEDWVGTTNNTLVLGTGEDPTSTLGIKIDGTGKLLHSGGRTNNSGGSNLGDSSFYRITASRSINQNDSKTFTIGGLQSGWMTIRGGGYSNAGQSQFAICYQLGGYMTSSNKYDVVTVQEWGSGVTITTTKNASNYQIVLQNDSSSYALACHFTIESSSAALNISSN